MLYNGYFESPLGMMILTADDQALCSVSFAAGMPGINGLNHISPVIEESKKQLQLYFDRQLRSFAIPMNIKGTDFQKRVLDEVMQIPYGQTITYLQLAHRLGSDRLTRAVAAANASNPFLILIPCHRVVGKNNSMTGYAGEIWRKEWLLDHEKAITSLF